MSFGVKRRREKCHGEKCLVGRNVLHPSKRRKITEILISSKDRKTQNEFMNGISITWHLLMLFNLEIQVKVLRLKRTEIELIGISITK